ncbi:MAG: shikimate dehydrogenase, partial [Verrucomicrobiales bacterium]
MDRAAVLGHPVKKSLSPKLFGAMAKSQKREVDYRKMDLLPKRLASFFRSQSGFTGFNVTIPHKEKVIRFADVLSPEVKAIGAANVLHVQGNRLTAYNTDVLGIRQTFREQGLRLAGKQAVLYGAGGAARAVAYSLTQEGLAKV